MFDPFSDYETDGYLRNRFGEKDPNIIRELEHTMFRAGLDDALAYLSTKAQLTYGDFLAVHKTLFSEVYPWAGKDHRIDRTEARDAYQDRKQLQPKLAQSFFH